MPVTNASLAGLVPTRSKMGTLSFLKLTGEADTSPAFDPCHLNSLKWSARSFGVCLPSALGI
jgi:hypothetical protein